MNAHSPLHAVSAPVNPLASRAMLSGLRVTMWTARKLDKGATADVHASHGASADSGNYNKSLIARDGLAGIVTAATAARTAHYALTLPWLDDGARILPAAQYQRYADTMRDLRADFEGAVDAFVSNYSAFQAAAVSRLGKLYNAADYPPAADIRNRFSFGVRILPMPDASDFRVELSDSQARAIRAEIETATRSALECAMSDAWARIVDVVGKVSDKLTAYKPATETAKAEGIFRDSLVENVRDLVDVLPAFNLTDDPTLSDIITRMKRDLCSVTAADLRDDAGARAETAAAAAAILADVSAYLA